MAKAKRNDGGDHGTHLAGEFRSGPVAGTAIIHGVTFGRKALQFAEVDGLAIYEGDIVLGPIDEVRATAKEAANRARASAVMGADPGPVLHAVGITGQQFRWPNATVVYEIDSGFSNPQRVHDAIAHWEANTRIRFLQRTSANAAQHPDFVRFVNGSGCSSNVGRRGGMQTITLGSSCTTGNAIHEIGHTVGLWHEQSREDRDAFVRIEWANIDPPFQHNFDQHIADGDDLGPYDYGSIMHYPPTAFSVNGQATIVALQPLGPGVVMGQRNGLSQGDIAGVHMMYPPPITTFKEVSKDPIIDPTLKEAQKDPILDPTRKEVQKDPILDPTIKEVQKDPIGDGTIKEVNKDPIADPTIKEVAFDPFPPIGGGGFPPGEAGMPAAAGWTGGAMPFVMAGQSQFGRGAGSDLTNMAAQLQALGQAVAAIQQQLQQLSVQFAARGGPGGGFA